MNSTMDFVLRLICVAICVGWIWRLLRCVHAWELVDKTELPSRIETIRKNIEFAYISSKYYPELSKKTIILALRCPKCGAAKIHKESA